MPAVIAPPAVGFLISEDSIKTSGALHTAVKTLSDGSTNPYYVTTWGPANPKVRLLLDQTPNPYYTR
jgi:hypothetical protein